MNSIIFLNFIINFFKKLLLANKNLLENIKPSLSNNCFL